MRDEIESAIISYIHMHCPQNDAHLVLSAATRLDELVLDSLELLELVFAMESRFGIETEEESLGEVSTLGDLVMLIDQALSCQAA
jgi:acyl carrier protein